MRNPSKERLAELSGYVLRSSAVEARMVIEMIGLMVEEARSRLVEAEGHDMYRVQGETRALTRLHKSLTIPPPSMETD